MHLRFVAKDGTVHYVPAAVAEIQIGDPCYIHGHETTMDQANSAASALVFCLSLGVWDCTKTAGEAVLKS